jgi:choline dehydrogenase
VRPRSAPSAATAAGSRLFELGIRNSDEEPGQQAGNPTPNARLTPQCLSSSTIPPTRYLTRIKHQSTDWKGMNFGNQREHIGDDRTAMTTPDALAPRLRPAYDIVVCGSGPGGSVAARRLAENSDAQVLLVEAGGSDDADAVAEPSMWPTNIGSDRDWSFVGEANPLINGRSIPLPMGKVLGGSSSINVMAWARGHRRDWDLFAAESGETAWRYDAVLELYRSIEDWHGKPDPHFRGVGGPVFVAPANDPHPAAHAAVDAARSLGIPTFDNANGEVMQSATGASIGDLRIRNGRRESVYQSYIRPQLGRENLTVLTHAEVQRLVFRGRRVIGVEIIHRGQRQTIAATTEVVLSMGAVNTPKVLMVSGLGDSGELRALGIPVVEDLPGVGRNLQDHVAFDLVWEDDGTHTPRNNMVEAVVFATLLDGSNSPDAFVWHAEIPVATPEIAARFEIPARGWILRGGIAHPNSRGRIELTSSAPQDPVRVHLNTFDHPADMAAAVKLVELCRALGNSDAMRPYMTREATAIDPKGDAVKDFVRDAATTYWHVSGTAKMGTDEMSVVDGQLRVYGTDNLSIADASIMPSITTANTMAPCVVIGERAAEFIIDRNTR